MVNFCFPFNTDLVIALLSISAMSGPGTLIRVVLVEMMGDIVLLIPSLIPNFVGCFVMGFHEGFAQSRSHKYVKIGISTGLCGSITTFSSFNFEVNILLISPNPQIGLYFASIAATFIGGIILYFLGEFLSSIIFTKKLEKEMKVAYNKHKHEPVPVVEMTDIDTDTDIENEYKLKNRYPTDTTSISIKLRYDQVTDHLSNDEEQTSSSVDVSNDNNVEIIDEKLVHNKQTANNKYKYRNSKYNLFDDYCIVLLWTVIFCVMYGLIIPLSFLINNNLWEAILMSPCGAILRWYMGKVFNINNLTTIPIGTFIVNVFGSFLFAMLYVTSHERDDVLWKYHNMGLVALTTGFCGCLTTVSSFVHEKFKLKREYTQKMKESLEIEALKCQHEFMTYKMSIIYFFLTLIVSQIITTIINVIDIWVYV